MFVSIQVMMWKKCFFSDSALLGKRGYGTMSTSFGHMFLEKSCFGRMFCYYELWFHFVRISWNICNYNLCWFELWTCCMVQREPWLVLVISFVVVVVQHTPPPPRPETLSINDCPWNWCSSSFAMIGNVLGRNPQL
jgi:hypothetical protein